MKGSLKQYVMISLGVVMIAVSIHFFLLPDLSLGGATGMALIASKLLSKFIVIPVSYLIVIVNIFLFLLGFLVIGNSFGVKTVVATLCLSGLIFIFGFFEKYIPTTKLLIDDTFLRLIVAVMLYAIGVGLVLNNYASTGGSDIVALILQKYTGLDLGVACLLTDFVITLSMGILYGANTAFYSLVGVIMNGLVIDKTINGLNSSRYCIINTNCPDKVCEFLLSMGRSANIYSVVGAYKKNTQSVIHTALSRRDFVKLKEFLSKNDESSFMVVTNAHSVFGYHWRAIKD